MSHEIEIRNGVASFAENGRKKRAWHNLGQVFDRPMTVKEALEASHANYKVGMFPLIALTPTLSEHMAEDGYSMTSFHDDMLDALVDGKAATIRMDTMKPLGIVSNSYGIVQNEDAFRFIDTLCTGESNDDTPIIESAGVLGRGERIFITAKFPNDIILDNKGDDRVEMYVVFTTSHDGMGSVKCMVTPVRVVCNNTLNMAMHRNAGLLSLRHSANIMNRLDLTNKENAEFAYQVMNLMGVYRTSLESRLEHLRNVKLAEKEIDSILAELTYSEESLRIYKETGDLDHPDIPTLSRRNVAKIKTAVENGVGQELGERGTGLWLVNGISTFYQNDATFRSDEIKFDSVLHGNVAMKLRKASELILE